LDVLGTGRGPVMDASGERFAAAWAAGTSEARTWPACSGYGGGGCKSW